MLCRKRGQDFPFCGFFWPEFLNRCLNVDAPTLGWTADGPVIEWRGEETATGSWLRGGDKKNCRSFAREVNDRLREGCPREERQAFLCIIAEEKDNWWRGPGNRGSARRQSGCWQRQGS